jgi:hypothetical protein
MSNSHFDKYETLFKAKPEVVNYIPFTKEQVKQALNNGDDHLNTLPLAKWDMAANRVGWTRKDEFGKCYKTLAEQVCLLKHAARYHYIN